MSFSKAKIQRFNDIKVLTPSPAKYNVTVQDKVKLGIISQSGTYLKKQEKSLSGSETGSVHSTPCFQTPPVPKKKKFLRLSAFNKTKTPTTRTTDVEELRDKIVECSNKDATITELTEQLEEMKEKMGILERDNKALLAENVKYSQDFISLKKEKEDIHLKCTELHLQIKEINSEKRMIRQRSEALKFDTSVELNNLLRYLGKFQDLHYKIAKEKEDEVLRKEDEIRKSQKKEIDKLKQLMTKELETTFKKLEESKAKLNLVEENFKEMSLLTEMQMKEKLDEVETIWKLKLEEKEKESEAILKECQAISEYNIIQSEIEKNQFKNLLLEKEATYNQLEKKYKTLDEEHRKTEEEINTIKTEKHAYELSITTFRDTIEVLKKRLINSDRDVEQLKEELGYCEEKMVEYEKKLADLTSQLNESQIAKEDLEMQYESTSKIMLNEVNIVEKTLLGKVEGFQRELQQLLKDREMLNEVLTQYHEQQSLITKAQDSITQSSLFIEDLEKKQEELDEELQEVKFKLDEETIEADQMRKKYIETSGKYDELLQQFEQVSSELQRITEKNEELEKFVGRYQEQLEHLHILNKEKQALEEEVQNLKAKYAELLNHQKKKSIIEDKENLDSPKCLMRVKSPASLKDKQSPGPLKNKNQMNHSFV